MFCTISRKYEFATRDKKFVSIYIIVPALSVVSPHPFIHCGIVHIFFKADPDIPLLSLAIPRSFK